MLFITCMYLFEAGLNIIIIINFNVIIINKL